MFSDLKDLVSKLKEQRESDPKNIMTDCLLIDTMIDLVPDKTENFQLYVRTNGLKSLKESLRKIIYRKVKRLTDGKILSEAVFNKHYITESNIKYLADLIVTITARYTNPNIITRIDFSPLNKYKLEYLCLETLSFKYFNVSSSKLLVDASIIDLKNLIFCVKHTVLRAALTTNELEGIRPSLSNRPINTPIARVVAIDELLINEPEANEIEHF